MAEPSPYKEFGISADGRTRARVAIGSDRSLFSKAPRITEKGHVFGNTKFGVAGKSKGLTCHLCRKPQFAVEFKKCRGKR